MGHTPPCPRCPSSLTRRSQDEPGAQFDSWACLGCDGRFLAESDLQRIEETVEPVVLELRRIPGADDQQRILECPVCEPRHPMEKFEHHRDRNVVLDRCPSCRGVWLDGGELTAIQEESLPIFLVSSARYFLSLLR